MTKIEVSLPDGLAEAAQRAGILQGEQFEKWVSEQLRQRNVGELFDAMDRMAEVP